MRAEELDPHSPVVARFSAHRHRDAEIPLVGVGYTRRFTLQLHEDGVTTIGREGGIGLEANVRNPIKGSSFGLQGEKVVTPDGDRLNLGGDLTTPASRHEFNVRRYGKVAAEAAAKKWYGDKDLTAVDIEDAVKVNHPNNPNAPAETRALAVLLKGIVADSDKQLAGVVREELHEPQGVRGGVDALGLGTGVELSGSRNRIFSVGTSIGEKSLLPDIEARKFGHIPSPAQTTKPVTIVPPSAPTSPRGSGFTHGKLLHREKF